MAPPALVMKTFQIRVSSDPPRSAVWYGKLGTTSEFRSIWSDPNGTSCEAANYIPHPTAYRSSDRFLPKFHAIRNKVEYIFTTEYFKLKHLQDLLIQHK